MKKGMIGLEIHTYLVTKQKLFCSCLNSRKKGTKPNVNICPICTGQPGSKPLSPSEEAVFKATQLGMMLGCKINNKMHWQRKHYSWPDLPKGYQITLSGSGAIPLGVNGKFHGIRIGSMHLEEDPASWDPETGAIDYNRSGLPLVEIVTDPDFTTSEEVISWLDKLTKHLSYLGIVDSDAGIKVDVNVNIPGKTERVEIKNINSMENISVAIESEFERQEKEGSVRETRRFNPETGKTERMRSKEGAEDYRFLRDPDLPLLYLDSHFLESALKLLPEDPEKRKKRFIDEFNISEKEADTVTKDRYVADLFENATKEVGRELALTWVAGELLRLLNTNNCRLQDIEFKDEHFLALLKMIKNGDLTPLKGKEILKQFYPKSFMPSNTEKRITDKKELETIIKKVISENQKVAEDYKQGNKNSLNFLLGQVMKATKKMADSATSIDILTSLLS
ncbi:MAG TPA: Asp-tRNA(Asn)/Glu-tRNA(Gln) amidotransferase subunit GatB [Candidatus Nanoarchaeia archaeon]|nr:Asp-tRNA(Asn)/Glu-tRNA(Gln) amidotransferase subunit GatB [Candidatus Nanoarchaeia archaeon]